MQKEYIDKEKYTGIAIIRKRNYREWEHFKTLLPIIGSLMFSIDAIITGGFWIDGAYFDLAVFFTLYIIMGVGLVLTGIKFYDFYQERLLNLHLAIFIIFLLSGTLIGVFYYVPLIALSHLSGLFIFLGIYYFKYCEFNKFDLIIRITSILSLVLGIAHITTFGLWYLSRSGVIWYLVYGLALLLLGAVGIPIGFLIYMEPVEKPIEDIIQIPDKVIPIVAAVIYCLQCGMRLEANVNNCSNCGNMITKN